MKKTWNKFLVSFANGIVLLLPVVITAILIRFLVLKVNDVVLNPIMKLISPVTNEVQHVYAAKIIIFILVISTVGLVGWAGKILFIHRTFSLGEKILIKLPVMGRIYNAVKQISSALIGQGKTAFKHVVLIEYPRKGVYSVGFTTGTSKGEIKQTLETSAFNVFIPTTPNPTSGVFLIVPEEEIHFLGMSVEEGMKLVISGGALTPPHESVEYKQ